MSETQTTSTTSKSKRASASGDDAQTLVAYEQAVEQGYIGGPVDDSDLTVQGAIDAPPISETSITHDVVPQKTAELAEAVASATDPNKPTG